jgi:DNA-binding CsgD family transcriptional regulator/PAS domain-containing protein
MESPNARHDILLKHIYDAVTEPTGFQRFVEKFVEVCDLKAVMMFSRNLVTQNATGLWACGIDQRWIESYGLEFGVEDMLAGHIAVSPIAHFYASNLSLDERAFAETRFYRDWVVPQGVAYASGAVVLREGAWISQIVLQRSPLHNPFTEDEITQFNRLIPHLQRSIQMRQRFAELALGQNLLTGGLDVLPLPTIIVDEFGRVGYANKAAHSLLDDTAYLRMDGDYLHFPNGVVAGRFNMEIVKAVRASRGQSQDAPGIVLLPRRGMQALMLLISPLPLTGPNAIRGAALVFAYDPESTREITASLVAKLFSLTEAESELAVALCSGKTIDQAADERNTSVHTTRSQLKSIFLKTGTSRQADLVSIMLTSPAYFYSVRNAHTPLTTE